MFARSFWASLGFAALASATLPALLLAFEPVFGTGTVVGVYLVATTAAYVAWIAPTGRHSVGAGIATLLAGTLLLMLLPSVTSASLVQLAIGCSLLVSVCRSGLFYRSRPLRAIVLETVLTLGGLLAARFLAGPSALAMAAGLWGYLLVQSLFCLAPGVRARSVDAAKQDPFEQARARLDRLLDELP